MPFSDAGFARPWKEVTNEQLSCLQSFWLPMESTEQLHGEGSDKPGALATRTGKTPAGVDSEEPAFGKAGVRARSLMITAGKRALPSEKNKCAGYGIKVLNSNTNYFLMEHNFSPFVSSSLKNV